MRGDNCAERTAWLQERLVARSAVMVSCLCVRVCVCLDSPRRNRHPGSSSPKGLWTATCP